MSASALLVGVGTVAPVAPVDGTDHGSGQGVVSVHRLGLADTTARCSCGWGGRRRLLKAAAEQDAWAHSMNEGCAISSPLVLGW